MAAVGAAAGGAAHEQVAVASRGQRHFLCAQKRLRVARCARRLAALAHGVLLLHQVDGRRDLGPGQRVPDH
uniref:Uncharacterized protein n=1 Tax=Tanacetum cinerariifolium TaxID=118510 RepID=A0A699WQV0_TANCI|nr:hypothetical protein [Tanacetum cinerariifolium]